MDRPNTGTRSVWSRVLLELMVSVIIPLVATPLLGPYEQVLLGAVCYILISVTRLSIQMLSLQTASHTTGRNSYARDHFGDRLRAIQESYSYILGAQRLDESFAGRYYLEQISEFADQIHYDATSQEIRASKHPYERTELLCDVIGQRSGQLVRLVFNLDSLDFMRDSFNRGYYELQVRLAVDKGARIRRLFLMTDEDQVEDEFAERVFDFHSRAPGFECRVLDIRSWSKLVEDLGTPANALDFGVWGERIVYKTIAASAQNIEGSYCFDERVTIQLVPGSQVCPLWSMVRASRALMPCLRVVDR